MKIDIQLSGTPEELQEFLQKAGYGYMVDEVINSLSNQKNVSLNTGDSEGKLYKKAFEKVNISALFLAYISLREGIQEDDMYIISFDELEMFGDYQKSRNVSSRIGGLRKVTDSLNINPVMEIERRDGIRHVVVHRYAIESLLAYFNRYDHLLCEYAEKVGEDLDLDILDI